MVRLSRSIHSGGRFDILVAPPIGEDTNLGTFQLLRGGGDNHEPVQTIDLGGLNNAATQNVEFVRFDIRSNFQEGTADVVGLSEVRFEGVPHTVPEPTALSMVAMGTLLVTATRRLGLAPWHWQPRRAD